MTNERFDRLLNQRIERIKSVLASKATEYASSTDRLHNFKLASEIDKCSLPKALWGMYLKHFVSLRDLVHAHSLGAHFSEGLWEEKLTDSVAYLFLLEACLSDCGEMGNVGWSKEEQERDS